MRTAPRRLRFDPLRLEVLAMLDRHGTLSSVALAMHLTPSAVSQQIAALSAEVGSALTFRIGRYVRLTEAGNILLRHRTSLATQFETLRADLDAAESGHMNELRIAGFSGALTKLAPSLIGALRHNHPLTDINVIEADDPDIYTLLDSGAIDMAYAIVSASTPSLNDARYVQHKLMDDRLDVIAPADHWIAGVSEVPLADLAREKWIAGSEHTCCGSIIRGAALSHGFVLDIGSQVNDWTAATTLVDAGLGIAVIPRLSQGAIPSNVVVRPLVEVLSRTINLVVPEGSEVHPVVRDAIEIATTTFFDRELLEH